jgi:hypothetical protein
MPLLLTPSRTKAKKSGMYVYFIKKSEDVYLQNNTSKKTLFLHTFIDLFHMNSILIVV